MNFPQDTDESTELGLISGLLEGVISGFEFRDALRVERHGESVVVSDAETGDELGGRWLVTTGNPRPVHEWLEAKLDTHKVMA